MSAYQYPELLTFKSTKNENLWKLIQLIKIIKTRKTSDLRISQEIAGCISNSTVTAVKKSNMQQNINVSLLILHLKTGSLQNGVNPQNLIYNLLMFKYISYLCLFYTFKQHTGQMVGLMCKIINSACDPRNDCVVQIAN